MKKIAITGGKGGTGKSTVATALAYELSKTKKVLLVDMDVDCPNDHLILSIKLKKVKDVKTMIPEFDSEKCIHCGRCSKVCRENAIVQVKQRLPVLVSDQCTGCKACMIACPVGAITENKQVIGGIYEGRGIVDLISGKMKTGIEESSLIVNAVKKYIKNKEKKYDYIIIDTAAGTHCPVIAALLGADIGFAVTEPTPLGNHDLILILKLMKKLEIKSNIVLNRADVADKKQIEKTAQKYETKIVAEIPYSKKIMEQYCAGKPIRNEAILKIARSLK